MPIQSRRGIIRNIIFLWIGMNFYGADNADRTHNWSSQNER